jgi:hypothetical protein
MKTKNSNPRKENIGEAKPYAPSFLDRFMRFVLRLPIPYWLTYMIFFFLQSTLIHALAWITGWLPVFTFNPILLLFPLWQWGPLAIITYLNLTSQAALSSFSPLLEIEDEKLKKLKNEFTTMPTRGVIASGVIWIIAYVILCVLTYNNFSLQYRFGNIFTPIIYLEGLISYSTGSAIYFHSLRQLWLVNRTVKMVKHFNLFALDPVYAFSSLTSRTGISWMIMLGLTLLMLPLDLAKGPILAIFALQVVLALAAFVLPLRFVNQHLVTEKRRLLAKLDLRVASTLDRLHHCLDENESGAEEQLYYALTGLQAERDILMGIRTWPWRTATLTGFLSAIGLPIALLLIQIAIQKWLGG